RSSRAVLPYTTLFRSHVGKAGGGIQRGVGVLDVGIGGVFRFFLVVIVVHGRSNHLPAGVQDEVAGHRSSEVVRSGAGGVGIPAVDRKSTRLNPVTFRS